MAKPLEFEEYSAKFDDADGVEQTTTVSACIIDRDNYSLGNDVNGQAILREFTVVGRSDRSRATPGMVLVKTAKPDEYDVHSVDTWKEMGFSPVTKRGSSASGSSK